MAQVLPADIRSLDDEEWLELLISSIENPVISNIGFPRFPQKALQSTFVGSANETALNEAFNFYRLVKEESSRAGNPIRQDGHFLDFGCGWGRYLRFFWKDVDIDNLYGCDVNPMIVDTCHTLGVPGKIRTIDPLGRLPYEDSTMDHVMAYSVFTHLPESVHLHWVREIARVTKPGAIFALTLEPRRFIDFIANIPEPAEHEWYRKLASHKPKLAGFYEEFDNGNLVFMPTNEDMESTYGDAVVPLGYIEQHWQPCFDVLRYIDNEEQFWQAVLVVQRTGAPLE